jgi:hypothetical protein
VCNYWRRWASVAIIPIIPPPSPEVRNHTRTPWERLPLHVLTVNRINPSTHWAPAGHQRNHHNPVVNAPAKRWYSEDISPVSQGTLQYLLLGPVDRASLCRWTLSTKHAGYTFQLCEDLTELQKWRDNIGMNQRLYRRNQILHSYRKYKESAHMSCL